MATLAPTAPSRWSEFRRSLSRRDKRALAGMLGFIVLLHVVGFTLLLALVAPAGYHLGGDHQVYTAGVGVLAYTFGLRHAFDADHIAAVDNTTRKLIADNVAREATGTQRRPRPLSVGFWFSLGHSTIVFALSFLLAVGVRSLVGPVEDDSSTLHTVTGVIAGSRKADHVRANAAAGDIQLDGDVLSRILEVTRDIAPSGA